MIENIKEESRLKLRIKCPERAKAIAQGNAL
jgi:hypothetical protein